ncbi:hypothetical protein RchiOBHm_Chr2g0130021 [Rosa chinensis]|uniref:Uncharacterized protein n=1 Tax=Rosa chinensis TaxID=74649 RepID=A0A2P6RUR1_ROSCH|nr:hypothetical protein RchiOBHm_Chr2g0130021 [Rosa chinensis]
MAGFGSETESCVLCALDWWPPITIVCFFCKARTCVRYCCPEAPESYVLINGRGGEGEENGIDFFFRD